MFKITVGTGKHKKTVKRRSLLKEVYWRNPKGLLPEGISFTEVHEDLNKVVKLTRRKSCGVAYNKGGTKVSVEIC